MGRKGQAKLKAESRKKFKARIGIRDQGAESKDRANRGIGEAGRGRINLKTESTDVFRG